MFKSKRNIKIEELFNGREPLSSYEFYEKYYKEKSIPSYVVTGVIQVLENELNVDFSKILKTDDFSKNLNFLFDYDSMVDVEIVLSLEKVFKISITDNEAKNSTTIDALIHLVNAKVQNA